MIPKFARRTAREGLQAEQWRGFVDDDLDQNDREHEAMRTEFRNLVKVLENRVQYQNRLLVIMLVSLTTSSILLALNLIAK